MKTKTKTIALLEIVVVLCSVFLVAIPAIAAEETTQKASATASAITTASEDDYVLGIYGNANEDDTIDMGDVVYTKLAIFGKKPKTKLCDAKYDGRINVLDVIQTKLIILGKEKELTIVDSVDRIVTVKKPVERIIPTVSRSYEAFHILGVQDKIVGVTKQHQQYYSNMLPEVSTKPVVGTYMKLDYEEVIELNPQIVFADPRWIEEAEKKLSPSGITMVALNFNTLGKLDPELKILAKIMGCDEKAEEFLSWKQNNLDRIKEKTEGLESKVRVYATIRLFNPYWTGTKESGMHEVVTMAGGYNIARDLPGRYVTVDPEWVLQENPQVIFTLAYQTDKSPSTHNSVLGYNLDSYEEAKRFVEERSKLPGLKETDAVKTGRVYIADVFLGDSGCRGFIGVLYYAKWFYPEQFEDLNPDEIHREYFEKWLDIEYRGIWTYPPLD